MTTPTPPSEMPRGSLLVRPGDNPANQHAVRLLKTDHQDWRQVSGGFSVTPLLVPDAYQDAFLAGWSEQSVATWAETVPVWE